MQLKGCLNRRSYRLNVSSKIIHFEIIYRPNRQVLVGEHLLLRDFGPYGIIFMNVCVVITVATVLLLRGFGPDGDNFLNHYFQLL
jgi:hypothetical protein